jgi:ABC-type tungstate transport system permease subunit
MFWICPNCNREFHNTNQSHSCGTTPVEKHFVKTLPSVQQLYNQLIQQVENFGVIRIASVKNAILISNRTTFLACKLSKTYLTLEFFLDHEEDLFPVYKTVRISKRRVVHFMKLQSEEELDSQLLAWLKASYELIEKG